MIWNFLASDDASADSQGLFPPAADNQIGLEVSASDASIEIHSADEVVVSREVDGVGFRPLISVRGAIRFVLTDTRLAVVTSGVASFGGPLQTTGGVPAADDARGGASLQPVVGHVELSNIFYIAVAVDADGVGRLQFQVDENVSDGAGERDTVHVEVFFTAGIDVTAVANSLLTRAVEHRIGEPAFASSSEHYDRWRWLAGRGFAPAGNRFEIIEIHPYRLVRRRALATGAAHVARGDEVTRSEATRPRPAPESPPPPPPSVPPPPAAPLPPPTWAADPFGRHQHRYWDGQRWTEHVSTNGVTAVDAPTPGPPAR